MHSRAFVVTTNIHDIPDLLEEGNIDEEIISFVGADYAIESESLEDDLKWLCEWAKIPFQVEVINGVKVGVISCADILSFLEKYREERIAQIKEELEKENPDFYRISELSYPRRGFIFYHPHYGVNSVIELDTLCNGDTSLYIVKSLDYHF